MLEHVYVISYLGTHPAAVSRVSAAATFAASSSFFWWARTSDMLPRIIPPVAAIRWLQVIPSFSASRRLILGKILPFASVGTLISSSSVVLPRSSLGWLLERL